MIHENNAPLQVLENGNIITDYNHTWNNVKIDGSKLIQFNYSETIDGKQDSNLQQEYKDAIHKPHDEQLEVLRIIESNADYKFSNIQKMSRPIHLLLYPGVMHTSITYQWYRQTLQMLHSRETGSRNKKNRRNVSNRTIQTSTRTTYTLKRGRFILRRKEVNDFVTKLVNKVSSKHLQ